MIQCKNKTTGIVLSLSSCESHVIQLNIVLLIQFNEIILPSEFFVSFSTMMVKFESFEDVSFVEALLTTEHLELNNNHCVRYVSELCVISP